MKVSLAWARNVCLNFYFLEQDAFTVFQDLNNGYFGHSEFGHLLLDVYSLLSFSLGTLVNHMFRKATSMTHVFVKFALELDDKIRWQEECPLLIESVIVKVIFIISYSSFKKKKKNSKVKKKCAMLNTPKTSTGVQSETSFQWAMS